MGLHSRLKGWLKSALKHRKRYVSSRHSRERLYHLSGSGCIYLKNILPGNRIHYKSGSKAKAGGLKFCPYCKKVEEQKSIKDYF